MNTELVIWLTVMHGICQGATFVWNGSGTNANWSTAGNWTGGVAPTNNGTAAIILAGTNQTIPNVDTPWSIYSLAFSANAGAFNLGGNSLTILGGGIINSNANPQIVSNNIILGTNQTWNAASNAISFAGNITATGTNLLTISGAFNTIISGAMSGGGGLTKTGTGTLILSASNSFAGLATVSAGVLNIQNSSALSGAGVVVASGAALQLQGGISVASQPLKLSGSGQTNSGALRNVGGSNSWSGPVTLGAATTIDSDAGTLSLAGAIVNSTFTTTFTNNGAIVLNGPLGNGSGGLAKIGSGTLTLDAADNYTGATTVSGGILQCGANGCLSGSSAVTVNAAGTLNFNGFNQSILSLAGAGSVTLGNGTLTVNPAAATTFSGTMSGSGGLVQDGTATFTLSGANTYSGGTAINSGAISVKSDTCLGNTNGGVTLNGGNLILSAALNSARPVTLGANNGTVTVSGNSTLSGIISGPGALNKLGSRKLTLSAINTYQGGTTNGAGTILIASDSALGNPGAPFVFATNATLMTASSFTSSRNFILNAGTATFNTGVGFTNTFNGIISGAGAFTKSGSGVLLLGGANTFTNTLGISAGTLRMGAVGALSSLVPVVITAASATFDLNSFNQTIGSLASSVAGKVTLGSGVLTTGGDNLSTTNASVISGYGSLTFDGSGTMILTGANTFTNTTTIASGTLQLGRSSALSSASSLVVSNDATFNLTRNGTNYNQAVASLAGGGNVVLGSGALTAGNAGSATFSGVISGTGTFTKVGSGTEVFEGTNSYSGATTISVGNLQVDGISTNTAATIASGATLSGTGAAGTVGVNSGATISPGATGPGTLASGSQTWAGGGNYAWEINNASGTQGGASGWDWLNISGTLAISASYGNPFNLQLVSLTPGNAIGQVANFDNTMTYIWTIASASGGITGFSPADFNIMTNNFQNPLGAGTFALSQSGNNINLIFTTEPAPVVQGVQSGALTSNSNGTNTVTLASPVNPANALLVFSTSHNSPVPGDSMIRGTIVSSNTLEFARVTTGTTPINIQWYVAQYSAGVYVQRGQVNQTNTIINIPLSPLAATNQAFVTWSKTPDPAETVFNDNDPVAGTITSVSNLQFSVSSATSSVPVISWQVIEFLNPAAINVQQGLVTNINGTNVLATATLASPVNTNSTFVLAGYCTSSSSSAIGSRMIRAQLTSANTITFDRSIYGAPDSIPQIFWQAVQLNDGSQVQSGSANFPAGLLQTNASFGISVDTNRTVVFASVQPAGGQNTGRSASTGSVLGVGSATLAPVSNTQLVLDRADASDPCDIGWSVLSLGPGSILIPATGGSAIPADTTGVACTSLTGPIYTELQSGNVGAGTIVLNAPVGFIFSTNSPQPTVLVTQTGGGGSDSENINGVASGTSVPITSMTTTSLTFTVTSPSTGGVTCSLMWQNLSVCPAAGTPLASGYITSSGTSSIEGISTNATNWGFLNETTGTAAQLALTTNPSPTAIAGLLFAQQPVIQVEDQFGNLEPTDDSTIVTVTNNSSGLLQGTTSQTAVGGVIAFDDLSCQIASTITLGFGAVGLTGATSGPIVVSPAAASQLTIQTQPSSTATAGIPFNQQPVIQVQDQFGNLCNSDNSTVVTASLDEGSDVLYGTLTANDVNGIVTFTNLSYDVAQTITIDFSNVALTPATCDSIMVNPAAASALVIQIGPSSVATAGVPFAQQPVIQIQDQFGNLCVTNNSTVVTASRDAASGSGTLQGSLNVTAVNGVAAFVNLAHDVAGAISVDFNSSGLAGATSSGLLINAGPVAQLAYSTQPGSAAVGSILGIQPALVTQDSFGNNSVSGLPLSLPVTIALASGSGTLQGTTALDIGANAGNGAVAFDNLEIDSPGSKQLTASASGLTGAVSSCFTVVPETRSLTITSLGNGSVQISGIGVPGYTYRLQYSTSANSSVWQDLENLTADSVGAFQYTDTSTDPIRFYRTVYP